MVYNNSRIQFAVYNTDMKEEANMKNRIIALALVIVMLFALSACGKKQEPAPAPTEAPTAAPTPEPTPEPTPAPTPEPTPEPAPAGIEPDSGIYSIVSKTKGFSVDYDSKYVANELPVGSIIINAGTDEGVPFVTVALMEKEVMGMENVTDAASYIFTLGQSLKGELGDAMLQEPEQIASPVEGRDLIGFYCSYADEQAGGNIISIYYAENLNDNQVVVYSSSALEEDNQTVRDILLLAIESFKLVD